MVTAVVITTGLMCWGICCHTFRNLSRTVIAGMSVVISLLAVVKFVRSVDSLLDIPSLTGVSYFVSWWVVDRYGSGHVCIARLKVQIMISPKSHCSTTSALVPIDQSRLLRIVPNNCFDVSQLWFILTSVLCLSPQLLCRLWKKRSVTRISSTRSTALCPP